MAETVPFSKFVALPVPGNEDSKISIKKFTESNGIKFKVGNGFYQLSKPEIIQLNKTILVQRIAAPDTLITGTATIRSVLGIDDKVKNNGRFMISDEVLEEFKIFVQSTSYNRNLIGGTVFLYRKNEGDAPIPDRVTSSSDADADEAPAAKRSKRDTKDAAGAAAPATAAPTVPAPSGSAGPISDKVEIVISFDTTGSMYPCLSTVRSVVRDTLTKLTSTIPSIRIGIIAHGDYCDAGSTYVTNAANGYKLCSAKDVSKLIDFVTNVSATGGGDFPECYELVLNEAATKFDWTPNANKSLIMIGDAPPHEKTQNPGKLDWRVEAQKLKDNGIRVYAVQALDYKESDHFYREVAQITLGFYLRLYQFSSITDFLVAVCYHEGDNSQSTNNLTDFEEELSSSGRMVTNLRRLFDQLQGKAPSIPVTPVVVSSTTGCSTGTTLVPVSPSRFQVLTVDRDMAIKEFAQRRGLVFKVGRGFYEFTKPESISDKKEVVLMDKEKEDFYTGWTAARELSGIEPGKFTKQKPKGSEKYTVFVQSTSYNRKLIKGQRFLYEVDEDC